jgi:F0F1-type ATP synthase assembly protein I
MKNASDSSGSSLGTQIMMASELSSVFMLMVGLGYFAGNWLDGPLKSGPYGAIAGLMLGMGLGLVLVVKRSNQLDKSGAPGKTESFPEAKPDPEAEAK